MYTAPRRSAFICQQPPSATVYTGTGLTKWSSNTRCKNLYAEPVYGLRHDQWPTYLPYLVLSISSYVWCVLSLCFRCLIIQSFIIVCRGQEWWSRIYITTSHYSHYVIFHYLVLWYRSHIMRRGWVIVKLSFVSTVCLCVVVATVRIC